jgi:hypothetical protein
MASKRDVAEPALPTAPAAPNVMGPLSMRKRFNGPSLTQARPSNGISRGACRSHLAVVLGGRACWFEESALVTAET